jgi:hypothetical protein
MRKFFSFGITAFCALRLVAASNFSLTNEFTAPPTAGASFGAAVALSGNTLVVSAPDEEVDFLIAGAAYVFVNTNGSWVEQARLVAPQPMDFEFFGSSIAVNGDTIVIGSYGNPETQAGAAYVFARSGESWSLQQQLVPSDAADFQLFGASVAVSGDTIAVGAFSDASPAAPNAGAVYAFVRNGVTWTQQQKIIAAVPVPGELLGYSVAMEGDNIAAGAPYADDFAGAAYFFTRSGGVWSQQARLVAPNGFPGALMGSSIALSGGTILSGAPEDDNGINERAGSAHVFAYDGASWLYTKLVPPNPFPRRFFGQAVAINGDIAVVGADGERDEFDIFTVREAYVFSRSGNVWSQQQQLTPGNAVDAPQSFGTSVAMSAGRIVLGDVVQAASGSAAYVYESSQNTAPTIVCSQPLQTFYCVTSRVPVSASVQVADADADALSVVWAINGVPFEAITLNGGSTNVVPLTSSNVLLAAGTNVFEVTVSDGKQSVLCQSFAVLVPDTQPPTISSVAATPGIVKHGGKMTTVQVAVSASDDCSAVTSRITNVLITDLGVAKGGKPSGPDFQITGPLTVQLSGQGSSKVNRTYTIVVETTDASGNVTTGSVQVPVQ